MGGYSKHRATAPSPDKALLKPFSIAGGSIMPCLPLGKPPYWGNRIGARGHTRGGPSCPGGPAAPAITSGLGVLWPQGQICSGLV